MDNNQRKQTAIAPAPFGMSACGHAFGTTSGFGTGFGTTFVARDRVAVIKADMGLAIPADVLGTTAWSPPLS